MSNTPFHLAIPVHDLQISRSFYSDVLKLNEGRSSKDWVDFDCYGHQLVIHEVENYKPRKYFNSVDKQDVPVPHFGVVLNWKDFWSLSEHLKNQKIDFQIDPYIRFEGMPGEQATMFFYDPSGNALEFKSFKDPKQLFKS